VCHTGRGGPIPRQDSTSSTEHNAVEQMAEDVGDTVLQPQFALRQDFDSRRPTAKVQVF